MTDIRVTNDIVPYNGLFTGRKICYSLYVIRLI
jgi:hypothetical protein